MNNLANQFRDKKVLLEERSRNQDTPFLGLACCLCCCYLGLILFAILLFIGALLLLIYGSICVNTNDYSGCNNNRSSAIAMIVFGVLILFCCFLGTGAAAKNKQKLTIRV